MKQIIQTPRDFINPLLSKKSVISDDFEKFEANLTKLLHVNITESEEHQKNALRDFLIHSFGYTINTKGKIDWAIFQNDKVEVLLEAKRLDNISEMITPSEFNRKALHEAILYFMQERDEGNNDLKHIIILTAFKWFVFDAKEFDRFFWNDKNIKKIYTNFKDPSVLGDKTKDFYNNIAKNLKENITDEIEIKCAYFDLSKPQSQKDCIAIYKLLSPNSLLKAFNPNDANTLNREFYSELLYILGLEEVKEGGKKLIGRAKNPQNGSFYENIAGKLSQYNKPNDFESIIKLMIIWINRILFLKLLESQIVKWNANPSFLFLNATKINDFDKLEMLFFEVLAKKPQERNHREFDYIPYLNSSLFELHEMEEKSLKISNLSDDTTIAYYAKTVIKDEKSTKKTGQICTLHYLFEFLDAYDFSSEGSEEVVSDNKTLINASVLGLIFEKLNGYKDGSFYTPSFITMYMAKESLTKAVLAKFFTCKGWNCQNLTDLHNKIEDIKEANDIINSLTLCDPAVGSGHFLVSALNEILTIKSTLGVLCDAEGKRLKGYRLELANDELIIKDDEGEIFDYQRSSSEKTRVQKALFKEKQRIIENSLFGVDINPNSVNICRLRLWIELLKNAYYKEDGTLDTLPNIDINIKCGNSLISRFDLKDELKIKNIKNEIENYKQKVSDYKENLGTKKDVLESINALKVKFNLSLKTEWKVQKALELKLKEYVTDFGHTGLSDMLILTAFRNQYGQIKSLFGDEVDEKKRLKLLGEVQKGEAQVDEIEKGKIYENAFEWRFEFPEVLDEKGNFVGFDVVIGNPPYIDSEAMVKKMPIEREFYSKHYESARGNWDLYILFLDLSLKIAKNKSFQTMIVPNKVLSMDYAKTYRDIINNKNSLCEIADVAYFDVFQEADVYPIILSIGESKKIKISKNIITGDDKIIEDEKLINWSFYLQDNFELYKKITSKFSKLGNIEGLFVSSSATVSEAYELGEIITDDKNGALKIINTGTIDPYLSLWGINNMLYLKKKYSYPTVDIPKIKLKIWTQLPKIIIAGMSVRIEAFLDEDAKYLPAKSTVVVHEVKSNIDMKYLLSLLNSHFISWIFKIANQFNAMAGGYMNVNKTNIFELPIPNISKENQQPFITLVDKILTCKASNPKADTSELEKEIDTLVYALYGLNDEEIAIVEGR
ncbi:MAG: Eco57I restriction-modification methylase domain-containing protein [Campylobacteraceae bacterium]|nr:Eco57I restriction-modification methylase domain-containing protein [Campylobacteraceae bacterium]